MTTLHYLVFVGATPSLSTELLKLTKRIQDMVVIAPAMPKGRRGLSSHAIEASLKATFEKLQQSNSNSEPARFSVWSYNPLDQHELELLWGAFGRASWVEFVPENLKDKDSQTRNHIEKRVNEIKSLLHEVSSAVFASRKTSPFTLPLENFESPITAVLKKMWYRGLALAEVKREIQRHTVQHKQRRSEGQVSFEDDRHLLFSPAKDTECHGKVHPTGSTPISFLGGRFQFGVTFCGLPL
ncbi:hypothetical protein LP421_15980 [Rhizobium sp. RCAM05350]|nr:hypothetical protein LP421_15980 [Rhizobium sp. RCAM05350]